MSFNDNRPVVRALVNSFRNLAAICVGVALVESPKSSSSEDHGLLLLLLLVLVLELRTEEALLRAVPLRCFRLGILVLPVLRLRCDRLVDRLGGEDGLILVFVVLVVLRRVDAGVCAEGGIVFMLLSSFLLSSTLSSSLSLVVAVVNLLSRALQYASISF